MSMTEDTFLRSLHHDPRDEVAWLALADWLEEHGQPDRARLVRLHRRLRELPWLAPDRRPLEQEMIDLLRAGTRPVVPEFTNSIGMRFALIPPGVFLMGSPPEEEERWDDEIQHEVSITKPFYLGVYTVTQAEYKRIMRNNPSEFSPDGDESELVAGLDTARFPVENVQWDDSVAFCAALSKRAREKKAGRVYRLPTEAEWEYACRAGVISMPWHFGDLITPEEANFGEEGEGADRTCSVGQYSPNAFGLYDMHGNVEEWCSDWFDPDYFQVTPREDPPGPAESPNEQRVIRGGTWDDEACHCRSAFRNAVRGDIESWDTGFRIVCEWHPPEASS
jgi:uncharacterized protein (TIGR02996 family)